MPFRALHRSIVAKFVILLAALISSGCTTVTQTYYRPTGELGEVINAWCPPLPSFVLVDVQDVRIGFRLNPGLKNNVLLTITLEIPENHSLSIPEPVVQIHTAEGQRLQASLKANTWVGPGRTSSVSLEEPLQGYTRKRVFDQITLYGKTEHAYFFLVAEFPAVDSDIVFLKPPIFFIDGSAVELDELSFKKTLGTIVSPVNC